MTRRTLMAGAMLAAMAGPALAQAQEKCFGVALAGQGDGIGAETAKASGTVNYQGNVWVWVPRGSCLTLPLPVQPDGTPRRGALQPLDRDRP
ncbi:MAG: DUF2282 domain-containing protein [Amaricoccus sp.]